MAGQGNAIFGIGIGEGENRATDAAYNAIHNPMLENSKIDGAKNLLVNICASEEITLAEVGEICKIVSASADKDYNMFWGQVTQPELEGKISVTVIATGFEDSGKLVAEQKEEEPVAAPEPKVLTNDVVGLSEMDKLLHKNTNAAASLGGEFVASHNVTKTPDADKKGSLAAGIFADDSNSAVPGSFVPPAGFVPDSNDLMKPAIWNKGDYSRTIRLDD
jgi:cell division protein FtsZ